MNNIEINIEESITLPLLRNLKEDKIKEAISRILNILNIDSKEISLYFCDNDIIRQLNNSYRKKDYPTDVLSFESGESVFLGDIAISVERAYEQMEEFGSDTLDEEILRLLIHGILHLLGYDHTKNEKENEIMQCKENELMLGVKRLTFY